MHAIHLDIPIDRAAVARAVRWVVLVGVTVLAMAVVLMVVVQSAAQADPGTGTGQRTGQGQQGPGGPDQTGPDQQLLEQFHQAQLNGTPTGMATNPTTKKDVWVGVPGTHVANHTYGYPYPAAGDCNEATLGGGCVGDARGFLQGQCTSWVAFRLSTRNGLGFSNWYAGMHWGNAADWGKVAKHIGRKPDRTPAIGAVGWYKRGHVSYVEDVYSGGTILISEMNYDGHNGFHFALVSPGMHAYPDKFIHLDDVVPVDTAPPSTPRDVRSLVHRGRTGITWRASTDAFGVAGYRVYRDGALLATTRSTSYWDRTPPAGQSAMYAVVAFDGSGHASAPGRVRVVPGTEAADRAWVRTATGPGFCGRTGTAQKARLGCRLLAGKGWRTVTLRHRTTWGAPDSRAFVTGPQGVSYCRDLGRQQRVLACTTLDTTRRTWSADAVSAKTPRTAATDRTWLQTGAGPAQCGLSGSGASPRVTCSVLTAAGWRTSTSAYDADWGAAGTRTFLAAQDGSVSFCRATGGAHRLRPVCDSLYPDTLVWQRGVASGRAITSLPADATWIASAAGPALCWSPVRSGSERDRGGCRVSTAWGWRVAALPRRADPGSPAARAFVTDGNGGVSWCRVTARGRSVACLGLSPAGTSWGTGRAARLDKALRRGPQENRAWVSTSAGPALCGRTGSVHQQRVGCQVLADASVDGGWRFSGSQRTAWGQPGYRAFVPAGAGVAYCRTLTLEHGAAVSCTPLSATPLHLLDWGATRTSRRLSLPLPDPF